ncbi:MAG: hypothetical protein ACI9C4_000983 [Paraglaciecola sp.]|jgi:hypothetical protein
MSYIASKYRIEFTPSRIQYWSFVALVLVLMLSIYMWQHDIMPYQGAFQIACIGLLGGYAWRCWQRRASQPQRFAAVVSYLGEWTYLDQRSMANWSLSPHSKITSLVLWVHLKPKLAGTPCWQWVFRDQVSEQDYRRLCRCIVCAAQTRH